MQIKGTLSADSGVKVFAKSATERIEYRTLSIFELGNSKMVAVSVPTDYVLMDKIGDQVCYEVFTEKVKYSKSLPLK